MIRLRPGTALLSVPALRGLGEEADVPHHGDARRDDCLHLWDQGALKLDRVRPGSDEGPAALYGLLGGAVGVDGQITRDVCAGGAIGDCAYVVLHHPQRHCARGVVTQFDLAQTVPHQNDVETHPVKREGHWVVVRRQHREAPEALGRPQIGRRKRGYSTSHMIGTRSSTISVTRFSEFTCTTVGS